MPAFGPHALRSPGMLVDCCGASAKREMVIGIVMQENATYAPLATFRSTSAPRAGADCIDAARRPLDSGQDEEPEGAP